jgi:hypothetical protein
MSVSCEVQPSSLAADVAAQAQAEAERFFGDGPIAAWRPPRARAGSTPWSRRAVRWVAAGCLAVPALLAVVAGAGWARNDDTLPESPVSSEPTDDVTDAPLHVQLPTPAVRTTSAPLTSATLNITRRGAEWRIEAMGVSRLVAAQRLAQSSGSTVFGNIAPLAATRPLRLSWQGQGVAGAWQAVLGSEVSFAMQCGTVRCRVWILEAGTNGQGPALTPRVPSLVPAAPATGEMAAAPPQSDSSEPRIAAHHD